MLINLPDQEATESFAKKLANGLNPPLVLGFKGHLGTGKTTIIRAMLRQLGITTAIKSPTFSIIESYITKHFTLHHFDLYRMDDEKELEYLGFRDYFLNDTICCIEWPERILNYHDMLDIKLTLEYKNEGRTLELHSYTQKGEELKKCLRY